MMPERPAQTSKRDAGSPPRARRRGWLREGLLLGTAALALAAGSCGGDSPSDPPATPAFEPKLSVIEAMVFGPSCGAFVSCHGGSAPQKDLTLSGSVAAQILDRMSAEVPSRKLIVPGDPDASFLYEKIASAKPASGRRMPDLNPPLAPGVIAAVHAWILAGAPNN
jgi:hypothetical protein